MKGANCSYIYLSAFAKRNHFYFLQRYWPLQSLYCNLPLLPSDQLPFFIYKLFDILFSDILLATVGIRGGFWPDSWSATAQVLSTNQIHGLLQLNYCLLIRFMVSTTKYCLIRFMVCYCSNIVNQSDSWSATSQILSTNQIHSLLLLKYCLPIRFIVCYRSNIVNQSDA